MKAVAVLAVALFSGTFTATLVDAGVSGDPAQKKAWVLWLITIIPMTLIVKNFMVAIPE
jgi:hypothetical protein